MDRARIRPGECQGKWAKLSSIFDPLGGVIVVDDERALDALSASTATIAAHLAYVAAVFGALSGTLLGDQPKDFSTLADEYTTARARTRRSGRSAPGRVSPASP
jgi:hypothetical protein